jgi:hypothetical protein
VFAILYIVAASTLFVLTDKYAPAAIVQRQDDGLTNLLLLGCFLTGAGIGWVLPAQLAPHLGFAWHDGWLERLAQVYGAVCGLLIAMRGIVVWATLFLLGLLGTAALALLKYLFFG